MPRIPADENIPNSVAEWLRKQGYTVVRTSDIGLKGKPDSALIKASQTEGWVILTLDYDFIGLHRQAKKPFGAIVVRTHPPTPDRVKVMLGRLLLSVRIEEHSKDLLVVTEREVRVESR